MIRRVSPATSDLLADDFMELLEIDLGSFDCRPSLAELIGAALPIPGLTEAEVVDVAAPVKGLDLGGEALAAASFCCRSLGVVIDRTF